jgi:hypothetical protein
MKWRMIFYFLIVFRLFCSPTEKLCIIDVSQSVEHDHPHSLEFLRMDCTNMTNYFQKNGVSTLSVRELFEFITDTARINKSTEGQKRDQLILTAATRGDQLTEEDKVAEEVFKRSFIPQKLHDVIDYERDVQQVNPEDEEADDASESLVTEENGRGNISVEVGGMMDIFKTR